MNQRPLAVFAALVLSLSGLAFACSSADEDAGGESAQADFAGVYKPMVDGPIGSIAFARDKSYRLMPSSCVKESCSEAGGYTLDAARTTLFLTDTRTGATRTLPIEILATTRAASGNTGLFTRDLLSGGGIELVKGAAQGGQPLVKGGNEALTGAAAQLIEEIISKANIGGQGMERAGGDGAGNPPGAAPAGPAPADAVVRGDVDAGDAEAGPANAAQ